MEQVSEGADCKEARQTRRGGDVCPSLVLAVRVVCDKGGSVHEPSTERIWEYCTTELHSRCPLRLSGMTPQ